MKTLSKLFFALILGVTLTQAAAFDKDAKYRTTKVHISSEKPVTSGTNTFTFAITKKGKKLTDSKVIVKAFMPAMPGMPAMESKVDAKNLGDGNYKVTLNLAMNGTWQIHIFIIPKEGKKSRVKTSINF